MVNKTCKSLIKYNVEHRRGNGKSYKGSKKKDERKKVISHIRMKT
jgi:hypothetical protein